KLQGFAMALAVALAGTHLVAAMGLTNIGESLYMAPSFSWLLLPLGGIMFGFGMSLANGCGARALILLGQGNLRAFVVLVCLGIAGYMTLTGIAAPLRVLVAELTIFTPTSVAVPPGLSRSITVWILAAALTLFAL